MEDRAARAAKEWERLVATSEKLEPGSREARDHWDEKAPSFAHKPTRSDYVTKLIAMMGLAPGETLFDMGCGSGTVSIPLAQAGHGVISVDFSPAMLSELRDAAEAQGVAPDAIRTFQASWQEPWDDLPAADVALSSRSFVVSDLAEAVAKLESKARRKAIVTVGAGDLPYRDSRVFAAMGREHETMAASQLACLVDYLLGSGRLPRVDYIEYEGKWCRPTEEALREAVIASHAPRDDRERALLDAYLDEHIAFDEAAGRYCMDYARTDRWAIIQWEPLRATAAS